MTTATSQNLHSSLPMSPEEFRHRLALIQDQIGTAPEGRLNDEVMDDIDLLAWEADSAQTSILVEELATWRNDLAVRCNTECQLLEAYATIPEVSLQDTGAHVALLFAFGSEEDRAKTNELLAGFGETGKRVLVALAGPVKMPAHRTTIIAPSVGEIANPMPQPQIDESPQLEARLVNFAKNLVAIAISYALDEPEAAMQLRLDHFERALQHFEGSTGMTEGGIARYLRGLRKWAEFDSLDVERQVANAIGNKPPRRLLETAEGFAKAFREWAANPHIVFPSFGKVAGDSAIDLAGIEIHSGCKLSDWEFDTTISFEAATVRGSLRIATCTFLSLTLDGMHVLSELHLDDVAYYSISAKAIRVRGDCTLTRIRPSPHQIRIGSINLDAAIIEGSLEVKTKEPTDVVGIAWLAGMEVRRECWLHGLFIKLGLPGARIHNDFNWTIPAASYRGIEVVLFDQLIVGGDFRMSGSPEASIYKEHKDTSTSNLLRLRRMHVSGTLAIANILINAGNRKKNEQHEDKLPTIDLTGTVTGNLSIKNVSIPEELWLNDVSALTDITLSGIAASEIMARAAKAGSDLEFIGPITVDREIYLGECEASQLLVHPSDDGQRIESGTCLSLPVSKVRYDVQLVGVLFKSEAPSKIRLSRMTANQIVIADTTLDTISADSVVADELSFVNVKTNSAILDFSNVKRIRLGDKTHIHAFEDARREGDQRTVSVSNFSARSFTVQSDVVFKDVRSDIGRQSITFDDARIGGKLDLSGIRLSRATPPLRLSLDDSVRNTLRWFALLSFLLACLAPLTIANVAHLTLFPSQSKFPWYLNPGPWAFFLNGLAFSILGSESRNRWIRITRWPVFIGVLIAMAAFQYHNGTNGEFGLWMVALAAGALAGGAAVRLESLRNEPPSPTKRDNTRDECDSESEWQRVAMESSLNDLARLLGITKQKKSPDKVEPQLSLDAATIKTIDLPRPLPSMNLDNVVAEEWSVDGQAPLRMEEVLECGHQFRPDTYARLEMKLREHGDIMGAERLHRTQKAMQRAREERRWQLMLSLLHSLIGYGTRRTRMLALMVVWIFLSATWFFVDYDQAFTGATSSWADVAQIVGTDENPIEKEKPGIQLDERIKQLKLERASDDWTLRLKRSVYLAVRYHVPMLDSGFVANIQPTGSIMPLYLPFVWVMSWIFWSLIIASLLPVLIPNRN